MPRKDPEDAVFADFNQDCTCLCLAHASGINVFSLESNRTVFTAAIGSIRLCQMLYSTSLLAYVGSGEQPKLTPRKLSLLNTTTQSVIQDLSFQSSVLAVRMNKKRLVAVLESKALVYALESLELLNTIESPGNTGGVCALTTVSEPCYLAVPAHGASGSIRVHDASERTTALAELDAHKSPVAALAWNHDGSLLASASAKGTVLRVHSLPQATQAHVFRRGASQARVQCLAFSAEKVRPPLLAAGSSHGTVHVWVLEGAAGGAAPAIGLLAAVIPASVSGMVDPQRSAASLRMPRGTPMVCAIQTRNKPAASQLLGGEPPAEPSVCLYVVTDHATLYTYQIHRLGASAPLFALEDECYLLEKA